MMMDNKIQMETIFGDGSEKIRHLWPTLNVKGYLQAKSIHDRLYQSRQCKRKGVFAAPYPGKILPIDLTEFQGKFICQKFFLCAAKGYLLELNSLKN
jgi:uncharacterized protein (AIM24 family)